VLAVAATAGLAAAPARASDATVEEGFLRGVAQIRAAPDAKKLEAGLTRIVARLRRDHGSTSVGRRGRSLAVQGFAWTLKGVRTQLDLVANDSGNIDAAVRHAKQADRYLDRGAAFLRSAGRVFGRRIGKLNGH
jgi:hypothetical protein